MKSYLVPALAFAVATTGSFLSAEVQQRQITKEVTLQFEEMNIKGDASKEEYIVKNPHFFWMDSSASAPTILGEFDLKGILDVTIDYKGNTIKSQSEGIHHFMLGSDDPEDALNFYVDGKIEKSVNADLKKIEGPIADFRAGRSSNETILSILEAISKASAEGKNLKFTGDGFGTDRNPTLVNSAKADYVHTSGSTPEEFTVNVNSVHPLVLATPWAIYRLPNVDKIDYAYSIKTNLPSWAKLLEMVKHRTGLPDAFLEGKVTGKSKLGQGQWIHSLTSKKLEENRYRVEGKLTGENTTSPDWVKEFQSVIREPIANPVNTDDQESESFMVKEVYDWLRSPKTTPFLKLFPLQSTTDWNGSLDYSFDNKRFSADKGQLSFSFLGKRKTGIQFDLNYVKGGDTTSNLSLVGGRPLYDHLVALYNAFGDSISSRNFPKLTSEDRNSLYNLLKKYSDRPEKADSELKFSLKYGKDGATIGGKDINQLGEDLASFYYEFSARHGGAKEPKSDRVEPSDKGFESYRVPPVEQKAPSVEAQPGYR